MRCVIKLLSLLFILSAILFASSTKEEYLPNAVVFMYHHFGEDRFPSTNIKLEQFKDQLDYLQKNHYNVWPLSKILHYINNRYTIPKKTVAITIDDAYISTYLHAYPMLKSRGFPYTVFVNTNAIGSKSINYMTWNQMREMKVYGAEFANHSSTHAYLIPQKSQTKEQWQSKIKNEIQNAQKKLQTELGSATNNNPRFLSYPFGEYTLESANYIQSLGYIGITQTSGVVDYDSDFKKIPRFAMSEKFAHIDDFILKLNTKSLPVKSTTPWDTQVLSNPPQLTIELQRPIQGIGCYTSNGERIDMSWLSDTKFTLQAKQPLVEVRDRYTCTASDIDGKWYWYSHLWIIQKH